MLIDYISYNKQKIGQVKLETSVNVSTVNYPPF